MPDIRFFLAAAICLFTAGCSVSSPKNSAALIHRETLPKRQVADFLSTACSDIWAIQDAAAENNPLYWLRGMECASRLSSRAAREEARQHRPDDWAQAFRRGILMANAKIAPPERRETVSQTGRFSERIPPQVRPLYHLWRSGQIQQLQLAESRMRYSQLQQTTDSELDEMRKQQQAQRGELELTRRKLENLTDIERQLSRRKPAGSQLPDAGRGNELPHNPGSAEKGK